MSFPRDAWRRTISDVVLLAAWTFSYCLISWLFERIMHLERANGQRA